MIKNLKEAIEHAKFTAQKLRAEAKAWQACAIVSKGKEKSSECLECAAEHEQLVDWLTELEQRRKADRWIPVSEKLPEDYTKVLITNEYGEVMCIDWNTWYQNEYKDAKKSYKATAWRPLPEFYKESEDE